MIKSIVLSNNNNYRYRFNYYFEKNLDVLFIIYNILRLHAIEFLKKYQNFKLKCIKMIIFK